MTKDMSHIHTLISGGDRKAQKKELNRSRAVAGMYDLESSRKRSEGERLIREADDLLCKSWNERMWSEGGPAQPSPTIAQATGVGYLFLEVICTRCRRRISVDLSRLKLRPDMHVHQLESSLRHERCRRRGETPFTILKQPAPRCDYPDGAK